MILSTFLKKQICYTLLFALPLFAQGQNLKQPKQIDINSFRSTLVDSLQRKGIDTVMIGIYGYDGSFDITRQFIFWKENKKENVVVLIGGNSFSKKSISNLNFENDILCFINYKIDTINARIITSSWRSHDDEWLFNIFIKRKIYHLQVLDYEKRENPTDIRSMWVNSIEARIIKYW
ncbi:MAG: PH domain-containing protein [Bacteroidia bacterium]